MKLKDALPVVLSAIESENGFHFYQHGTSMLPMLRDGIDSVVIVSKDRIKPTVGDVIFYRRKNGDFVLHRIIAEKNGAFTTCGDNQTVPEKNVSEASVIGVLMSFYRGDELVMRDNDDYCKYVKKRLSTRRCRYIKSKLKGVFVRLKKVVKKGSK